MELHGTQADDSIPAEFEGVERLREVTFILSADEMSALSEFFAACARGASAEGEWDHEHFRDHLWKLKYDGPDVVVYRK